MKRIARALLCIAGLFVTLAAAPAKDPAEVIDGFRAEIYRPKKGPSLPYRLFSPPQLQDGKRCPLVLFLHGFEALGKDNKKQISGMDFMGSHVWADARTQAIFPAFVLAPQCPFGGFWASPITRKPSRFLRQAVALVRELEASLPVDPNRIYVTGQSLGGFGTWAAISDYPEIFAAAAPVCGGGSTSKAAILAQKPVWAFHGSADPIVWPMESRRMISAIRKAGGNPLFTEYPLQLHNIWNLAYSNPGLVAWLYAQRLSVSSKGE